MELESAFESDSNGAVGSYRQNALFIRMTSAFDLHPSEGEPLPAAVAFHAHEYVHYLHNISTTAGQAYLLSNLTLLRVLTAGCDNQGYFCGPAALSEEQRVELEYVVRLMGAQLGTAVPQNLTSRHDLGWECEPPEAIYSDGVPTVKCTFKRVVGSDGADPERVSLVVGLSFITEGVAYEVEREMRRKAGIAERDLDAQVRFFPYLAFRTLVRHWAGRELEAEDFISIGVTALACMFSGRGLAEICQELNDETSQLHDVLKRAHARYAVGSERVLALLREQRQDLSKGDATWAAMGEYMALAEAGVGMRKRLWAPEFVFLEGHPSAEEFLQRIGAMIDCLVIQEKPGDELEMNWIGPGHVATTESTAQHLGSLQAAIHFSQLHLTSDGGARSTIDLGRHPTKCPFSGGCQSQKDDGYPPECQKSPWARFTPSGPGDLLCWYAAGVKTLKRTGRLPASQESDFGDPGGTQ